MGMSFWHKAFGPVRQNDIGKIRLKRKGGTMNLAPIFLLMLAPFPHLILSQSSTDTLRLLQTLPVSATYAATDNLSNLYVITPGNAIEKYAPDGRRLARYSNNRLGQAARLDVSNPLKVLVWYADFRTAVMLDRSLTELGELNLIAAGYPEVRTVAAAQDGSIWLYDEVNFRLVKITPDGEKRCESQAMNLLEPVPNRPSCIREGNDRVLMADSLQGVFVFDLFAQFDRIFTPQHPVVDFQIVDNQLHYLADNRIIKEHIQVRASRTVHLSPAIRERNIAMLSNERLLVLERDAVKVYAY